MKTLKQLATNPNLRYIVVNRLETNFWSEDIQKNIKKAYGQYLVDLTESTHLCELVVSYPAYWIRNEFVGSKFDEERTFELERECGNEFEYWRGDTFAEPVSSCYLDEGTYQQIIAEETKDYWIEKQIEYYQGNYVNATV